MKADSCLVETVPIYDRENEPHTTWSLSLGSCKPYTEDVCRFNVISAGLKLGGGGYKFADNHATKGCYAYKTGSYKGMAFYGLGGSEKDISVGFSRDSSIYRPEGYDCFINGSL